MYFVLILESIRWSLLCLPTKTFLELRRLLKALSLHVISSSNVEHLKLTCLHELYKTFNFCLKF